MEQPRIKAPELQSVLSPLIVVLPLCGESDRAGWTKEGLHPARRTSRRSKGHISVLRHGRTNASTQASRQKSSAATKSIP